MTWRCRRCGRFVVPEAREGDRCTACAIHIRAAGAGLHIEPNDDSGPAGPGTVPL